MTIRCGKGKSMIMRLLTPPHYDVMHDSLDNDFIRRRVARTPTRQPQPNQLPPLAGLLDSTPAPVVFLRIPSHDPSKNTETPRLPTLVTLGLCAERVAVETN